MTEPFPRDRATAAALARLYDLDLAEDPGDVDLYRAVARRADGRILELAVGTGRVAIPLVVDGWSVTGVDLDPAMLARARATASGHGSSVAARLDLVEADLVGLRLPDGGTYAMAFIALNSLLVLGSRAAQRAAFRAMADHLAPGGLAVVDVWQPQADDLARFDGRVILEYPRLEPETGLLVTKVGSAQFDASTQVVALTTIYEEGPQGGSSARWLRTDRLRLVSADELAGFAEDAGLEVELVAGGYALEPMGPATDRAILVAIRP